MAKKIVKESPKRPKVLWLVTFFGLVLVLSVATLIPVERMRYSGGCRSKDNRLSLILDGQQEIQRAREKVEEMNLKREERLRANPVLEGGCSQGLSYAVYIL